LVRLAERDVLAAREELSDPLGNDAADQDHDKTSLQHFNRAYPAEYRLSQEMPNAVAAMARIDPHSVVAGAEPQRGRHSIVHWAYFAALGCLVGSVLLRRV